MEALAVLGRIISAIFFLLGFIFLFFSPTTGIVFVICGIVGWNLLGLYFKKNNNKYSPTSSDSYNFDEETTSLKASAPKNHYICNNNLDIATSQYYSELEEIESMWSVIHNLKITSGPQIEAFETKCKENIIHLSQMLELQKKNGFDGEIPPSVPAYKRLVMLYEKQERYDEGIEICVAAIKEGATEDGTKGKMYGRLARLIKKSGKNVDELMHQLLSKDQ